MINKKITMQDIFDLFNMMSEEQKLIIGKEYSQKYLLFCQEMTANQTEANKLALTTLLPFFKAETNISKLEYNYFYKLTNYTRIDYQVFVTLFLTPLSEVKKLLEAMIKKCGKDVKTVFASLALCICYFDKKIDNEQMKFIFDYIK